MSKKKTPYVGVVRSGDETTWLLQELGLDHPRTDVELRAAFVAPLLGKADARLALEGVVYPLLICPRISDLLVVGEWHEEKRNKVLIRAVLDHDNIKRYWKRFEPREQICIASLVYEFEEHFIRGLRVGNVIEDRYADGWIVGSRRGEPPLTEVEQGFLVATRFRTRPSPRGFGALLTGSATNVTSKGLEAQEEP